MQDFLTFVDANGQLNGHSANSSRPTHYFLSKFSTLQAPAPSCPLVQEQLSNLLLGSLTEHNVSAVGGNVPTALAITA